MNLSGAVWAVGWAHQSQKDDKNSKYNGGRATCGHAKEDEVGLVLVVKVP